MKKAIKGIFNNIFSHDNKVINNSQRDKSFSSKLQIDGKKYNFKKEIKKRSRSPILQTSSISAKINKNANFNNMNGKISVNVNKSIL